MVWYGMAGALNLGEFRVTLSLNLSLSPIRSSASLSDNGGKKNTIINKYHGR